jgi:hypothetical protein
VRAKARICAHSVGLHVLIICRKNAWLSVPRDRAKTKPLSRKVDVDFYSYSRRIVNPPHAEFYLEYLRLYVSSIHPFIHPSIHPYIHTYIHTYIYTYTHIYIHTYVRACIHTYTHTHTYTDIHTQTHTYIYIHIYIYIYAVFIHETLATVLSTGKCKEKYFAMNIVKHESFSEQK